MKKNYVKEKKKTRYKQSLILGGLILGISLPASAISVPDFELYGVNLTYFHTNENEKRLDEDTDRIVDGGDIFLGSGRNLLFYQKVSQDTNNLGAIRDRAGAVEKHSLTAGIKAFSKGEKGIAVGYDTKVYVDNGIAIGSEAISGSNDNVNLKELLYAYRNAEQEYHYYKNNEPIPPGTPPKSPASVIDISGPDVPVNNGGTGTTPEEIERYNKAKEEYDKEIEKKGEILAKAKAAYETELEKIKNIKSSIAIGSKAVANLSNSIALGDGALTEDETPTTRSAGDIKTKGLNKEYTEDEILGNKLSFAGGDKVVGVLSIGNAEQTRRIQNVAPGLISKYSTDAINGSQLYSAMIVPAVFYNSSNESAEKYETTTKLADIPISSLKFDFGYGIKAEKASDANKNEIILVSLDKESLKNDDTFKGKDGKDGKDGENGKSITVSENTDENGKKTVTLTDKDGNTVTVSDGKDGKDGKDGENGKSITVSENTDENGKKTVTLTDKDGNTVTVSDGKDGKDGEPGPQGPVYEAVSNDNASLNIELVEGKNIKIETSERDSKITYTIATTSEIKDISSISNGTTKISLDKTDNSINVNGAKITNVAAGEISSTSTDAVNGSQLNNTNKRVDELENGSLMQSQRINELADDINHVGSLSAALSALKPMQYDPLQPNQVMAGVGVYRNKQAAAVGMTHYFNENLMMNAGVAIGGERRTKAMANIGLTWKIGKDEDRENLPERYKEGPIGSIYMMQEEMEKIIIENKQLKAEIEEIKKLLINK